MFSKIFDFFFGKKNESTVPEKRYTRRKNNLESKKKGKKYEEIIAKLYSLRGYTVLEHGKEKGKRDRGIDLIATKENETILIQCKNWKASSKYRIRHQEVKKLRAEARDFLEDNNEYITKSMKLLFVLAEVCVHHSAKHHLEDIKSKGKKVDIEIISIASAELEIAKSLDALVNKRQSCPRCKEGYLVQRALKNNKFKDKYQSKDFLGCSRYPKCRYSEALIS